MDTSKTFLYDSPYGTYDLVLVKNRYANNGNTAITAYCNTDGYWEPYASITVNLGYPLEDNEAFIDTNNLGDDFLDWLEENELAYATGETEISGYCEYPLVELGDYLMELPYEE